MRRKLLLRRCGHEFGSNGEDIGPGLRQVSRTTSRGALSGRSPRHEGGGVDRPSSILRTAPHRRSRDGRKIRERRLGAGEQRVANGLDTDCREGLERLEEGLSFGIAETGADLADIGQAVGSGEAEEERPEAAGSFAPPLGPAADDDLLGAEVLDLHPVATATCLAV